MIMIIISMKYQIPHTDINWQIKPTYTLDMVTDYIMKHVENINRTGATRTDSYNRVCEMICDDGTFEGFIEIDIWEYPSPEELARETGVDGYIGNIEVSFKDVVDKRIIYVSRQSYYDCFNSPRKICEIIK